MTGATEFAEAASWRELYAALSFIFSEKVAESPGKTALSPPNLRDRLLQLTEAQILRLQFSGANDNTQILGLEELSGRIHYLRGNDCGERYTAVPAYAKVMYRDVYSGINLLLYGNQEELEPWTYCPRCWVELKRLRQNDLHRKSHLCTV